MEWVETTGRTVEDAKEAALDQFGVDESDAEFEVVEEARAGLFGRLRGEARVRARVRPTAPRAKDDRRDRRRRARANGENRDARRGPTTAIRRPDRPGTVAARSMRRGRPPPQWPSPTRAPPAPLTRVRVQLRAGRAPRSQWRPAARMTPPVILPAVRPSRRRKDNGSPTDTRHSMDSSSGHKDHPEEGANVEVALDEQGRVAQDFLTDLVAEFGLDATVEVVRPDEETVDLQLEGSDLGLLIGPRGTTLLALQDLTRTFVHHRTGAANGRLHVDVGGYRQKRTEALVRFAQQVASTVQTSGTRTVLEPMTAADRKVVHDAITPIDGVSTISEGEEPQRRVVVVPANP